MADFLANTMCKIFSSLKIKETLKFNKASKGPIFSSPVFSPPSTRDNRLSAPYTKKKKKKNSLQDIKNQTKTKHTY